MQSLILSAWLAMAPLLAAAAPGANATAGMFSGTCTGVHMTENLFLYATCTDANHRVAKTDKGTTSVDLASCIGLDQVSGEMQWESYGKFSNYCHSCNMTAPSVAEDKYLITCTCMPLAGVQHSQITSLNLDEGIANDNGTLKCADGVAVENNVIGLDGNY